MFCIIANEDNAITALNIIRAPKMIHIQEITVILVGLARDSISAIKDPFQDCMLLKINIIYAILCNI